MQASRLEDALRALGEQLAADGEHAAIVVVGGAALAVMQLVPRTTNDVDVIALADRTATGATVLRSAVPLPTAVTRAIGQVARDLGLPPDWMNSAVGAQFALGLPPAIEEEIAWRGYSALEVGFAGRRTLIALKLFAAIDLSKGSVHVQDLIALAPTRAELEEAAAWIADQDASPQFPTFIAEVIDHVFRSIS